MDDRSPLEVHPPTVAQAGVAMDTVALQLQAVKDVLDHHCTLPSAAFGWIGSDEVRRYNDRCLDVSTQVAALLTKADDYAQHLAHNTIAYVTTEAANVQNALHSFDRAPAAADGAPNGLPADLGLDAETLAARALTTDRAAALKDRMFAALRGTQAAKIDEIRAVLMTDVVSLSPAGVVLADTPAVRSAERLDATVTQRLSSIAKLSKATDTVLALGRPWSIAALAASMAWSSNLLCPSDDEVNVAVNAWAQIAKAARSTFDEEVEAIARKLFAGWTSTTGTAARTAFAEFQASGRTLADHAERMATFLATLIENLDTVHKYAFSFASGQLVALIAYATLSCFPTPAAAVAKAAVEIIGQILRVAVSAWVTIVASLVGMLMQAVGTFETVPGNSSWATA